MDCLVSIGAHGFTSQLIIPQLALLPAIMTILQQALFLPGNLKKNYIREVIA